MRDSDNGQNRNHGERRFDNKNQNGENRRYGERRFDNRNRDGERRFDNRGRDGENRRFGDRPQNGERRFDNRDRNGENRRFDDRRANGDRPQGERRFDKRQGENRGERRFDNRNRDGENRRFGDRPQNGSRRFDSRNAERKLPPKSARDVALAALGDVVRNEAYASQALDRALTGVELSDEDRRLAASLFYFAVENRLYIDWALGRLLETRPEPLVNDILHLAAAQLLFMNKIPDHAAVDEAVKMVRYMGRPGLDKLVNGVLRSLIRARDEGDMALPEDVEEAISLRCSLALPAVKRLAAAYGAELTERIASYSPAERTLTVRPNLTQTDPAAFEAYLDKEGFRWKRGAVENAYILSGAGSLAGHEGYRTGMFSIQGESSMLAAQAVGAKRGMQILDACAAPGGKTCLMAEQMGTSGRVHAWDVYPHRVELIRAAAKRLHLENVRPAVHDARKTIESMELAMDAVLVDAPCSGLGVMADKPDIRFRVTDQELTDILPLQAAILENCAKMVRVGGRLVYSTCTILPEENQNQVLAFLEKHPEFELDMSDAWLPETLRGRMEDGMLQLLPARDGVEGFFIARMIRRKV